MIINMDEAEVIKPKSTVSIKGMDKTAHGPESERHIIDEKPLREPLAELYDYQNPHYASSMEKERMLHEVPLKEQNPHKDSEEGCHDLLEHNRLLEKNLQKLVEMNRGFGRSIMNSPVGVKERSDELRQHVDRLLRQNIELNLLLNALKEDMDVLADGKPLIPVSDRLSDMIAKDKIKEHLRYLEHKIQKRDGKIKELNEVIESLSKQAVSLADYKIIQQKYEDSSKTVIRLGREIESQRQNLTMKELTFYNTGPIDNRYEILLNEKNKKINSLLEENGFLKEENLSLRSRFGRPEGGIVNQSGVRNSGLEGASITDTDHRGEREPTNPRNDIRIAPFEHEPRAVSHKLSYCSKPVIRRSERPTVPHYTRTETNLRNSVNHGSIRYMNIQGTQAERKAALKPDELHEYSEAQCDRVLVEEGYYGNIKYRRYYSPAVSRRVSHQNNLVFRDYSIGSQRSVVGISNPGTAKNLDLAHNSYPATDTLDPKQIAFGTRGDGAEREANLQNNEPKDRYKVVSTTSVVTNGPIDIDNQDGSQASKDEETLIANEQPKTDCDDMGPDKDVESYEVASELLRT